MTDQAHLANQVTLSLITADLLLVRDLVFSPRLAPVRDIASLALMPVLSTFMVESARYAERTNLVSVQDLKPHEALLRTSRQRLKLLDDDRRSMAEILERAATLATINSSWFLDAHRGPLGPLKRLLQSDLGIFFLHDEVLLTTHVAFLNMGLTEEAVSTSTLSQETLGPYLKVTAEDFGRYLGLLMGVLKIDARPPDDGEGAPVPRPRFRDVKSERFYGTMADRVAPQQVPVCILLTAILSQVDTARILVPLVTAGNGVAAFKVGFVSLFHAASSLQRLLDENRKHPFLHPEAARRIGTVLGDASIRAVRKNGRLRRTLVHYGVDERTAPHLSHDAPLFGLVEACSSGRSLASVAKDVDAGLARVSNGLRDLLIPGLVPQSTL